MMQKARRLRAVTVVGLFLLLSGCSAQRQHLNRGSAIRPDAAPLAAAAEASADRAIPITHTPDPRDIRVMSFNVRVAVFIDVLNGWRFRREMLVRTIRSFDPHLLGTQEAIARQTEYLREQLSDYEFVGVGRGDGDRRGEMVGIFFKRDRFDKLNEGHFWLSRTPERAGSRSWGSRYPRMVTWVALRDRMTGSELCLFNTHFDHRGRRAREQAAVLLRERVAEIAGDRSVVITGDFNTAEGSKPHRTLIAGAARGDARFVDTYRAVYREHSDHERTHHGFSGRVAGPRIDWIVTCKSFKTLAAAIDRTSERGRFPSDHYPVTATIRPLAPQPVAGAE